MNLSALAVIFMNLNLSAPPVPVLGPFARPLARPVAHPTALGQQIVPKINPSCPAF